MNSFNTFVSSCHLFYLTRFWWENRCLKISRNTVALNLYLGLSALSKTILLVCIKFNKGATLCQNILNALRIFARISKFRFCCFDETKQTQNDVGKFFYNFAEFVFEFFCDSRRILATCKVLSQFAFSNMIVPLPKSQTRHSARARAPLHLLYMLF